MSVILFVDNEYYELMIYRFGKNMITQLCQNIFEQKHMLKNPQLELTYQFLVYIICQLLDKDVLINYYCYNYW